MKNKKLNCRLPFSTNILGCHAYHFSILAVSC